jgi:hypothetical protein
MTDTGEANSQRPSTAWVVILLDDTEECSRITAVFGPFNDQMAAGGFCCDYNAKCCEETRFRMIAEALLPTTCALPIWEKGGWR